VLNFILNLVCIKRLCKRSVKIATEEIRIVGTANMTELEKGLNIAGMSLGKFNKHMKTNFLAFGKNQQITSKLTGQMQTYGQAINQAAIKGRRFKMEWLGIMFAGMALDRAFGGLVRTQLKLFGVTEMMSSAWTIVMLPVMEKILPMLYNLIDVFMNLPESVKLAIGTFILFGALFGKILLIVGQVMLAITSLAVVGPIFLIAVAAVSLFIPLMAILIGYFTNLEKNTKGARTELTKMGVDGDILLEIVKKAKKAFFWVIEFFGKLKVKVMEWFSSLWEGFKKRLPAMLEGILNLLKQVWTGFKKRLPAMLEVIIKLFNKVWSWLVDNIPRFIKMGGDLLLSLVDGILNNIDKIIDAITFLIDKIVTWISDNLSKVIKAGLDIILAIAKGIIKNIDKIIIAIFDVIKEIIKWVSTHGEEIGKIGLELAWGIIKGLWEGLKGVGKDILGWLTGGSKPKKSSGLRMFQTGGLVTENGPAILHRGERVVPKGRSGTGGEVTFSPTINLNASINNDMDVRLLAEKLNGYWAKDFERLMQRGSY